MTADDRWARYRYDMKLGRWRAREGWRLQPPPAPTPSDELLARQRNPTDEDQAWMAEIARREGLDETPETRQ